MKVQTEELGNCEVKLTVEVPAEKQEEATRKVLRAAAKNVRIPGFRPGKAPANMVRQSVGEAYVLEEVTREVAPDLLVEAIEQSGVDVFSYDHISMDIAGVSPLTISFVVPTAPKIKLGALDEISVEMSEVAVAEERVDEALAELRESRATLEPSMGPAAYGDTVTVDMVGQLMDGSTLNEEKGVELLLAEPDETEEGEAAAAQPEPTVESQIVGMMVNQVKEAPIVYPAEYPEERLKGRTVLYRFTLLDVKKRNLPELDDEFAQEVAELPSVDALRERVRENLVSEAKDEELNRQFDAILDALVDESELSYPTFLVEHEVDRRIENMAGQLQRYGIPLDNYLSAFDKNRDSLRAEMWDDAERFVERSLVLSEYVRSSELTVTDEEVEREIGLLLGNYPPEMQESLRQQLRGSAEDLEQVRSRLLTRKAIFDLHQRVTGADAMPLFPEQPAPQAEAAEPAAGSADADEPAGDSDEALASAPDESVAD